MANIKISQLPEFTGSTDNSWLILNNSGQTETFKITRENFLSGITTYTEITYSELYSLFTGETLTPGQFYLMTDFQTCYDQPDFDQNGNAIIGNNYKTGTTEPIVVLATSINSLSPKAYSLEYPFDDISYDITFTVTERTGNPAKGRITERIDERGNRTDYDFRAVLFKRYDFYYSDNYYTSTLSIDGNGLVTGVGTFFSNDFNVGDILGVYEGPFSNPSGCFKYYEILTISGATGMTVTGKTIQSYNNTAYSRGIQFNNYRSFHQTNIASNTAYTEYLTFDTPNVFNVKIGNYANLYYWQENSFLLSNNVFFGGSYEDIIIGNESYDNTFDDDMNALSIGNNCYRNIITNDFDRNTIGNYFRNNIIICDMADNQIGNYFQYNMLGDNDGFDFDQNRIRNYFEGNFITFANDDFYNNDIGDNFYNNLINYGFQNNYTTGNFYNNRIDGEFSGNKVGNNFYGNGINSQTTNNVIGYSFQNNTIENGFVNNKISNEFKGNMMIGPFESNNVDSFIGGNQFSGYTYNNNIGDYTFDNDFLGYVTNNTWYDNFYNNVIEDSFNDNIIGNSFYGNNIGTGFYSNSIKDYFYNNNIGNGFQTNVIGNYFNENTVGDNFGYGYANPQGNKIGSNFYNNTIGEYFYNNSIADNFKDNVVGNYFQWNVINTEITQTNFAINNGNITGFTYIATGTTATNGSYTDMEGTTNGLGVNAYFDIEVLGGEVIGVSAATPTTGYKYQIDDTITILGTDIGGVHNVIVSYSNNGIGKSGVTGNYPELSVTGGSGTNANFDVNVSGGLVDSVAIYNVGTGYEVGDTLTILGSQFGGINGVDDITITVNSIYTDDVVISVTGVTSGSSFYQHYTKQIFERRLGDKRVSFYDEDDILNVDSIYEVSGYIPVYSQSLTFPISYVSFEFWCDGGYINNGQTTNQTVNNTQELVTLFNNNFRLYGYFFDNNDGTIGLYINPSLKEQHCPSGTYTIYVFND